MSSTAIDWAGDRDATLVDFADPASARSLDVPAVLTGLSLLVDNTTPSDRLTISPLTLGTTHSLGAWVKLPNALFMLFGQANGFGCVFGDGGGLLVYRDSALNVAFVSYTPPLGTWFHLGVSRSPTTVKFYVNGVQIGADQPIAGATGWDVTYLVGPTYGIGVGDNVGFIDEQRIYLGTELSAAQWLELTAGNEATGAEPSHFWKFDEGWVSIESDTFVIESSHPRLIVAASHTEIGMLADSGLNMATESDVT